MSQVIHLISADPALREHWQNSLRGYALSMDWPDTPHALLIVDDQVIDWEKRLGAEQLRQWQVVLASSNPNDEQGYWALQHGFSGYCHAYAPEALLKQVIEVVQAGEIWAGRSLVQRLVGAINRLPSQSNALQGLSDRETQVAHLTAKGLSNKEIARQLDITERTVKAHLTLIFEKLGVSDRVQLVLRVNGLA